MQCPQTDMAVFPQFRVLALRKRSNSKAMFSLSFDSNHSVLLAQFAGVLSSEDFEGLDKALAAFVIHHGGAPSGSRPAGGRMPRTVITNAEHVAQDLTVRWSEAN
jgi:hypothetical protein